jgi:aquaporin related protein
MFMTALLVFTIFMLAAEKHRATFIAPIGIGLALFVAHLAGARFTGGSYPLVMPQKDRKFGRPC